MEYVIFKKILKIQAPTSPSAKNSGSCSAADSIWIIWIMKSTRSRKKRFRCDLTFIFAISQKCEEHIFFLKVKKGRAALFRNINRRRARKILNKIPLSKHVGLISRQFYKRHVLETWARNFLQAFYFDPDWATQFLQFKIRRLQSELSWKLSIVIKSRLKWWNMAQNYKMWHLKCHAIVMWHYSCLILSLKCLYVAENCLQKSPKKVIEMSFVLMKCGQELWKLIFDIFCCFFNVYLSPRIV